MRLDGSSATHMPAHPAQEPPPLVDVPLGWILATSVPLGYWCRRCDARIVYAEPVPIHRYLDEGRGFHAAHRGCRQTAT